MPRGRKKDKSNPTRLAVLDAIDTWWEEHGYAPSMHDISNMVMGQYSGKPIAVSLVKYWVDELRDDGLILCDERIIRSIRRATSQ